MKYCKNCNKELTGRWTKVFCSSSCSASYNNRGIRRHGNPKHKCKGCTTLIPPRQKWCSNACQGRNQRKYKTQAERLNASRKRQRETFMRYYSRKKYQTPHDADLSAIKDFYANCPDGYEVDHIIPISKGGLHSIENLQYLTVSENRSKGNKLL